MRLSNVQSEYCDFIYSERRNATVIDDDEQGRDTVSVNAPYGAEKTALAWGALAVTNLCENLPARSLTAGGSTDPIPAATREGAGLARASKKKAGLRRNPASKKNVRAPDR
jgi:hypothetical protein